MASTEAGSVLSVPSPRRPHPRAVLIGFPPASAARSSERVHGDELVDPIERFAEARGVGQPRQRSAAGRQRATRDSRCSAAPVPPAAQGPARSPPPTPPCSPRNGPDPGQLRQFFLSEAGGGEVVVPPRLVNGGNDAAAGPGEGPCAVYCLVQNGARNHLPCRRPPWNADLAILSQPRRTRE